MSARSLALGLCAALALPAWLVAGLRAAHPRGAPAAASPADCCVGSAPTIEREQLEGYFPDVPLVTQEGETVRFYTDCLRGKVVLVNFMFTTCRNLCPLATENLVQVQARLADRVGRDVHFYSISVDPENDGPAQLKRFAESHGVKPGWTFLTGRPGDVRRVLAKLGSFERKKMDHTGLLVYGNETTGKWMSIYSAAPPGEIVQAVLALPGGLATASPR